MGRDDHDESLFLRAAWVFPVGLFLLALLTRLLTLSIWPFNGLYGQDPYFYDRFARDLWSAAAGSGPLPRSGWPAGYPLMVAMALPLTGFSSSAGQVVSLLAGGVVTVFVYFLARELLLLKGQRDHDARWMALVAGLLTAVSGQLWQSSLVAMSDTSALCWATLSAWAVARYSRRTRVGWLLVASFALGWAVITRWEYALLAVPFAAYLALQVPHPMEWRHLVAAGAVGLIVLIPQFVLMSGKPAILDGSAGDGWTILNAFRREFVTGAGLDRYAWPTGFFYAKPVVSPGYLFPLFAPALVLGIILVLRRRWWEMAALLQGWGLMMYVVLAGLPFQNFRYSLVYLPPVMILTAWGLRWVVARMTGPRRVAAYALIGLNLLAMAGWGGYRVGALIQFWQADKATVRWAAGQLPANATLFSHGLTLIARHETSYQVFDLFELTPDDLGRLTADGKPDYLLVDELDVRAGWAGMALDQNYQWLRDGPGLNELGQKGPYTLSRVGLKRR